MNQQISRMSTVTENALLARRVADEVVERFGADRLRWVGAIPVERIAAQWGLEFARDTAPGSADKIQRPSSGGLTRGLTNPLPDPIAGVHSLELGLPRAQYEMHDFGAGYRRRFIIAHELAHVVFHQVFPKEEQGLPVSTREKVIDGAAGMILLPDVLLMATFGSQVPLVLNIDSLESASQRVEASLSALLTRLNDASRRRVLPVSNVALIVDQDRSRKRSQNLAPRVRVSCLPRGWFLPHNKRLASLGMERLAELFHSIPLYRQAQAEDRLKLWHRDSRSWRDFSVFAFFKCYSADEGVRKMLVVITSPLAE